MQTAESQAADSGQTSGPSLDPYGQLIRMLLPRAVSIAVYDRLGLPVWLSDGHDAGKPRTVEAIRRGLDAEFDKFTIWPDEASQERAA